ncbi:MAG: hypothetical protein KatS3mg097_658 [Candidatus Parcubacteria bacterium]|nr:MAG: hypothetical protein KatS3mg097_658 [Candidatus Parcubacteria bacterium]
MKKLIFLIFIGVAAVVFLFKDYFEKLYFQPQKAIEKKVEKGISEIKSYEIVFSNLEIPWSIVFLNENQILVTERQGRVKIIDLKEKRIVQNFEIKEVKHIGEGGLLGAEIHPKFKENGFIYLYYTTEKDEELINRVERYILKDSELTKDKVIVDNIPASSVHNGGRIKFSPDGYLYITTGDAGNSENAQNVNSLAGKILRVKDDGSIPEDNPFKNEVYAYGIRNSQGISWDKNGNLWSIDHGRSGIKSGLDEINLIEKGKNYGWPLIQGDEKKEGMETPIINSGPDITWAPADLIYYEGNLFFTGLRGQGLYQYNIQNRNLKVHFFQQFGRLRALTLGPDGYFYLSTSNRDGRNYPQEGDDKIIKITPQYLLSEKTIYKNDQIEIFSPKPNEKIKSPLKITGQARGNWFFEATFPIVLTDWNGKIIAESYAQAKGEWMTTDFVPFEAILNFETTVFSDTLENHFSRRGYLILQKNNPSGLPEHDNTLKIPVIFDF